MTEAEKQAIDNFKFFNEGDYITKEMEESKDVVLNLIENQQAEINNLKNRKERQLKRFSKYKENIENKHEEIYEDLVQEIEKKDEEIRCWKSLHDEQLKIIDEMVYYLSDFDIDEMCEQCECCIGNGCHADDDVEFKMRCIKEYFKKKVNSSEQE